jgi:hypothetical protein
MQVCKQVVEFKASIPFLPFLPLFAGKGSKRAKKGLHKSLTQTEKKGSN